MIFNFEFLLIICELKKWLWIIVIWLSFGGAGDRIHGDKESDKGKGEWRVEGNYLEVGTSKETEFLAVMSGPWVME